MVKLAALGIVLCSMAPSQNTVLEALKWLARHQAEDGSWGAGSECRCITPPKPPAPLAPVAPDPAVGPLVDKLGHDDPEERAAATVALLKKGTAAIAALEKVEASADAEVRSRASDILGVLRRPAPSALVRPTSLALLAFLGAGYSHLSREKHGDLCFGTVVKKALIFLLKEQTQSGLIGGEADHAVATLALTEAYGLTGSQLFKDPTQRAVDALCALRAQDGSWEGHTISTTWAVMALKSAEISGLELPADAYRGALAWIDSVTGEDGRIGTRKKGDFDAKQKHDPATAGGTLARLFIEKNKSDARLRQAAELLMAQPESSDVVAEYLTGIALFQYDGPAGSYWKGWKEKYWKTAAAAQAGGTTCERGAWTVSSGLDRVSTTALYTLSFEFYGR